MKKMLFGFILLAQMLSVDALENLTGNPQADLVMGAVASGDTRVAQTLINNYNVDVNFVYPKRMSLLFVACQRNDVEVARSLLSKSADPNVVLEGGAAPLLTACAGRRAEIVRLLLKNNADPNVSIGPLTALMMASEKGYTEIVKLLLEHEADPSITNETEWTAMKIAAGNGHKHIVELLQKKGLNGATKENDGWSAFMVACNENQISVVRSMIDKGIDCTGSLWNDAVKLAKGEDKTELLKVLNDAEKKSCTICHSSRAKLCSRCRQVHYCSQECQKVDWSQHKPNCKPPSEPTA